MVADIEENPAATTGNVEELTKDDQIATSLAVPLTPTTGNIDQPECLVMNAKEICLEASKLTDEKKIVPESPFEEKIADVSNNTPAAENVVEPPVAGAVETILTETVNQTVNEIENSLEPSKPTVEEKIDSSEVETIVVDNVEIGENVAEEPLATNTVESITIETEQQTAPVVSVDEVIQDTDAVHAAAPNQPDRMEVDAPEVTAAAEERKPAKSKKPAGSTGHIVANTTSTSLGLLAQYTSDSSEEGDDDDDGEEEPSEDEAEAERNATKQLFENILQKTQYRTVSSDEESSETESDSDVEFIGEQPSEVIQINDDEEDYEALYAELDGGFGEQADKPKKIRKEFTIRDLPPIGDLTMTVSESECIKLGTISGTVDLLVLVESLPNFAAMDIDTVLFLDKGNRTLGQVFDVMGNVSSPIYCVRFNTKEDIEAKGIRPGIDVYVAPNTEHTNFIVLNDLMKQKGCDASWEDDGELPPDLIEYSDDEEELRAHREARHQKRPSQQQQRERHNSESSNTSGSSVQTKRSTGSSVQAKRSPRENNPRRRNRQQQNRQNRHRNGNNFYKDNRNYAEMGPSHQQNGCPPRSFQQDHSWHTAGLQGQGPSQSSIGRPTGAAGPPSSGNIYPNPFARRFGPGPPPTLATGSNVFNSQAFPPLPPPTLMGGPSHPQHFNRNRQNPRFSNFNQRNRQNNF